MLVLRTDKEEGQGTNKCSRGSCVRIALREQITVTFSTEREELAIKHFVTS